MPGLWPAPFTVDATTDATLIDLGRGHFVRAARGSDHALLRSCARPRVTA
jgi:hypothetical protein